VDTIDALENKARFDIAKAVMPTTRDEELFTTYFLGALMNYVPEEVWARCVVAAVRSWCELNQVEVFSVQFSQKAAN
jgi:hypothetical protein